MNDAAQPLTDDSTELSPWWLRTVAIVLVVGFAGLLAITVLAYRNAPPIPGQVVDAQGNTIFTGDDISKGQAVFLRYGLMDNGSIWGHGAYLGPDYSAEALHFIGQDTAAAIAEEQFGKPIAELDASRQAAVRAETAVALKANRYDAQTDVLRLTAPEAAAYRQQVGYWTDYFKDPTKNGGLKPDLITDPTELHQFTAFVTWAAWASVANRPGTDASYTNNFPYDPSVGNLPTSHALLWSALSLLVLLAGIAAVLLAFGKFDYLGWISRGHHVQPQLLPGKASPGQRALVKFFVVVALLFLMQTLVGGGVAHFRADPGSFYGFQLENIFPSNLLRTWHLQTAIFWIATAYVAAALFLGRSLRADEPRWFAGWVHLLFAAFVVVIGGSLLGVWAGIAQKLGTWWFWIGNQGWEYLELGRIWQYLLVVGLLVWFGILWALARPRVVATWRFWIIHLWVEGFFEFFATTVVALTLYQLGLAHRNVALRVIYLDAILYFLGGLIGTGHHWYFTGQSNFNMAMSAMFSVLEVVPLTLLTLDAWDFVRATKGKVDVDVKPTHGHAALMGVFGMLALALMVFTLRQTSSEERWPGIEKYVKVAFWGTNVGLAMMLLMSLFPSGVLQLWDVVQHGYWHARSIEYMSLPRSHILEWLRLPGDLVFIIFGAIPLVIATIKGWLGVRADAAAERR